jgi:hypothetical protein
LLRYLKKIFYNSVAELREKRKYICHSILFIVIGLCSRNDVSCRKCTDRVTARQNN